MKLGEYLRTSVKLDLRHMDLNALDFLAGKNIGDLHFDQGLEIPYKGIYPYTSPFFYPIGDSPDGILGLHLYPEYLDWDNLAVSLFDHGDVIDKATNLAEYVFRYLRLEEALCYDEEEDPAENEALRDSIKVANEAFGPDFYSLGRFGVVGTLSIINYYDFRSNTDKLFELEVTPDTESAYVDSLIQHYERSDRPQAIKTLLNLCQKHCSFDHPIAHRLLVQLLMQGNISEQRACRWVQDRQVEPFSNNQEYPSEWEQRLLNLVERTS